MIKVCGGAITSTCHALLFHFRVSYASTPNRKEEKLIKKVLKIFQDTLSFFFSTKTGLPISLKISTSRG